MAVSVSRFQFCAIRRYGGIGRHMGLKILRALNLVPVQVRSWAPEFE